MYDEERAGEERSLVDLRNDREYRALLLRLILLLLLLLLILPLLLLLLVGVQECEYSARAPHASCHDDFEAIMTTHLQ